MIKKMICTECPKSCALSVEIEGSKIIKLTGHKCPKGEKYASSELENPMCILTSTVLTKGLGLKLLPVRTDRPVPKARILEAVEEIRRIELDRPVKPGDIIVENLLCLNVNVIATRNLS